MNLTRSNKHRISTMALRKQCRVKSARYCWLRLGCFFFLQFLCITIVILSRNSFTTAGVYQQRPLCLDSILSSVESNTVLSPGSKAILLSAENKVISSNSNNAITTNIPKTIKKPVIDMVNDYEPFIDFKFVFPEIMPIVKSHANLFLVVLVNSGARGDKHRKRRAKIRQTWEHVKNCKQLRAMNNPKLRKLKWILVFVVGKVDGRTKDDEMN